MRRLGKFLLAFLTGLLFSVIGFQDGPITIYLVGDSTMSDKALEFYPETGWGMPFPTFFNSSVRVENHAVNGRSTRTFMEEGRWQPILDELNSGDYVFIQFGHNDEVESKGSYTTRDEFKSYLVRYVTESRAKGANPVLLTSIARRIFDNGDLADTHKVYSEYMREVARSENVFLIDMDQKSRELLQVLGPVESRYLYNHLEPGQHPNYPDGLADNTHFNELGARRMAELVIEGIRELELSLADKIRRK